MTVGIDFSHVYIKRGGTVNSVSVLWIWIREFWPRSDPECYTGSGSALFAKKSV
jgi:hypothetical protein